MDYLLLFVILGAVVMFLTDLAVEKWYVRDHEVACFISVVIGVIVLVSPLKALVMETLGTIAESLASWVWAINYGIAWCVGVALVYAALRTWRR